MNMIRIVDEFHPTCCIKCNNKLDNISYITNYGYKPASFPYCKDCIELINYK